MRLMRRSWGMLALLALTGFAACMGMSPEEQAALAAQGYYSHLAAGEYEQFLEGRVGTDSLPTDYREQLLTACRQFAAQQQHAHGGISGVEVASAVTDSLDDYTCVMLLLCYGDSTAEEIAVPMVCRDGRWRMR